MHTGRPRGGRCFACYTYILGALRSRRAAHCKEKCVGKLKVGAEEQAYLDEITEYIRENVRGPFRPCAFYTPGLSDVRVMRKDCSYTAKRVSQWADVFVDTYCPWYKPWAKYVGFEVYCPPVFGFLREKPVTIPVRHLLDRVLVEDPYALGKYRLLFYWLARGLTVRIHKEGR